MKTQIVTMVIKYPDDMKLAPAEWDWAGMAFDPDQDLNPEITVITATKVKTLYSEEDDTEDDYDYEEDNIGPA